MGLLDMFNIDDPQTFGLLSAAAQMAQASGPSLMPKSTMQIIGQGFGGYADAYQDAKKLKLDEMLKREQLNMLQFKDRREQQKFDMQSDVYRRLGRRGGGATGGAADDGGGLPPAAEFMASSFPGGLNTLQAPQSKSGLMNPQGQTPASHMDGGEFYRAAAGAGLSTDNGTLNKIVDLVNRGIPLDVAARTVAGSSGGRAPNQARPQQQDIDQGGGPNAEGFSLDDLRAMAVAGIPGAKELFDIHKYENDPQKLEGGSTYRDRRTGAERYMPKLDNGFTMGPGGVASLMPGYAASNATLKGAETEAQERARASYDIVKPDTYPSINGEPVNGSITRAQLVDRLRGGPPQGSSPGLTQSTGAGPVQGSSSSPWSKIEAPGERDQVRSRTYDHANKSLDDLRAQVARGRDWMTDLDRFGKLNQQTGTGGLGDRLPFIPSVSDDKREMESIQARLAPNVRPPGSGSSSDRDTALYLASLPSVDKTGDVNKNIRVQFADKLKDAEARLKFKEQFLIQNGHLQGADQAYETTKAPMGFDPTKLNPQERAYLQQQYPDEYASGVASFNKRGKNGAQGGKVATLSDIAETARRSGKSTAQVTADLRAAGYKIGGQ